MVVKLGKRGQKLMQEAEAIFDRRGGHEDGERGHARTPVGARGNGYWKRGGKRGTGR